MVIFFDLVGTLFRLDRAREAFRRHAVPEEVLPGSRGCSTSAECYTASETYSIDLR